MKKAITIWNWPLGEVPKLAEGTPLERVQVVNSGARVQIPLSPSSRGYKKDIANEDPDFIGVFAVL